MSKKLQPETNFQIVLTQIQEANLQGFTARNMWRMKQFYETYCDNPKLSALLTQLTWSPIRQIIAIDTPLKRALYIKSSRVKLQSSPEKTVQKLPVFSMCFAVKKVKMVWIG